MQLADLLKQTFGFAGFRANQEAVCRAATDGRDVLLVMPTGAGKSLCYQLPAIARGGTGLVVSPLIALMDDQAAKLSAAGLKVARIHSGLPREDARQACRDYLDGKLQFLFIAPERMRVPGFPEMLARRKPALVAIDEAHCISAWGHDFRPDYRMLGDYLPALRPSPIIALTATATPTVQRDIVTQLQLKQPELFIHGFRRDNLAIEVVELSKPRRPEFIANYLSNKARRPAIVYAPSRKVAEELAGELGRRFPAAAYHAGLDAGTRERVQKHFQSGKLEVVVATIAFGMGIDKADVRTVMHAAMPASVEAYYQEIGRAGRDGGNSATVLLYSYQDRKMHDFFLERDYPAATELTRVSRMLSDEFLMPDVLASRLKMDREVFGKAIEKLAAQGVVQIDMGGNVRRSGEGQWQTGYEQQMAFRRSQIDAMQQFAETQQCRMTALIRHFGDLADGSKPCGRCDFCSPENTTAQSFAEPDAAEDRHLRAILRALAAGSKSTGKLYTEMSLGVERREFDALLDGLARAGLVVLTSETFTSKDDGRVVPYKKAALTHEGREIGPGVPLGVVLRASEEGAAPAGRKPRKGRAGSTSGSGKLPTLETAAPLTPQQEALEARLRAWRKAEAAKTGKPAFIVFSDKCLEHLVQAAPATIPALLRVPGIGQDKADRYGAAICALCAGGEVPGEYGAPAPTKPKARIAKVESPVQRSFAASAPSAGPVRPQPPRERTVQPEPFAELTADQQAIEQRLREWRKAESEKMGLPQFFVLGTSALRSIVVQQPKTLAQLGGVQGIGQEKLDRFGASILQVLHG